MSSAPKTEPGLSMAPPEALVDQADFLRLDASRRLDPKRQVEMGQFMTPAPIARVMASMFEAKQRKIRLLDAGAGVGSLSAAFVGEMCSRERHPDEITVVTYEIDPGLIEGLNGGQPLDERVGVTDVAWDDVQTVLLPVDGQGYAVTVVDRAPFGGDLDTFLLLSLSRGEVAVVPHDLDLEERPAYP